MGIPDIKVAIDESSYSHPHQVILIHGDTVPFMLIKKLQKILTNLFVGRAMNKELIYVMDQLISRELNDLIKSGYLFKIDSKWHYELTDEEKTEYVLES